MCVKKMTKMALFLRFYKYLCLNAAAIWYRGPVGGGGHSPAGFVPG